jgi:phage terminase Nu1 subunit (DNA packaging protein)
MPPMSDIPANRQTVAIGPLARLCNLTPARCSQLANEGVMHKAAHGQYYLLPSVNGYIRYLQEGTIGKKKSDYAGAKRIAEDDPRSRLADAKARIAEAEAAQLEGDLLPVSAIAAAWAEIAIITKTKLLSIESAVPPEARAATRSSIHDALNELADYNPEKIAEKIAQAISGSPPPAAEPDGQ